jgi:hypothetical protein
MPQSLVGKVQQKLISYDELVINIPFASWTNKPAINRRSLFIYVWIVENSNITQDAMNVLRFSSILRLAFYQTKFNC